MILMPKSEECQLTQEAFLEEDLFVVGLEEREEIDEQNRWTGWLGEQQSQA